MAIKKVQRSSFSLTQEVREDVRQMRYAFPIHKIEHTLDPGCSAYPNKEDYGSTGRHLTLSALSHPESWITPTCASLLALLSKYPTWPSSPSTALRAASTTCCKMTTSRSTGPFASPSLLTLLGPCHTYTRTECSTDDSSPQIASLMTDGWSKSQVSTASCHLPHAITPQQGIHATNDV